MLSAFEDSPLFVANMRLEQLAEPIEQLSIDLAGASHSTKFLVVPHYSIGQSGFRDPDKCGDKDLLFDPEMGLEMTFERVE